MSAPRIYLDYNASTPVDPAVAAAMRPFLADHFGNPSSGHWASIEAKTAIEAARGQVAALLGCQSDEIVFTSGGSEANNLALKGVFFALRQKGEHIITTRIEHPAIVEPCRFLERLGARVTFLPVDRSGRIDPDDLRRAITPRTILVSIMHANNEVGTIQPIEESARHRARARRPVSHRRSPVSRQDFDRCEPARRRPPVDRRPQGLCPQGRWCPVLAPWRLPRAVHARCRTRRRPARRHRERIARGRPRQGMRACARSFSHGSRARACAIISGWSCRCDLAIVSCSTGIRCIACRTRSMFRSSAGLAPRYWRDSTGLPPQPVRHVIPGGSSSRQFCRRWASRPTWAWVPSASVSDAVRPARRSTW